MIAAAFTGPMSSSEVRDRVCDRQSHRTTLSEVGSEFSEVGSEFSLMKVCAVPGRNYDCVAYTKAPATVFCVVRVLYNLP